LPEIVVKILMGRGFKDAESIRNFVYNGRENLFNPFLLEDMHKSALRIKQAIEQQEQILIYADRDVDGITSLAILFNTIRTLGGNAVWYIPSDEGYGISNAVLDRYHKSGIKLIITVDCGISSVQEVAYANSLQMQVIVTDHHEPPIDALPEAYAVIDPKKTDSKYPFKELAGCGISFKVSQALMQTYGRDFDKELFFAACQKTDDEIKVYVLKVKNEIVIEEQEVCFSAENKNLFNSFFKNKKVFTIDNGIFDSCQSEVKFIDADINDQMSLKDVSYSIFEKYRKKELENDGRMAEFFDNNIDLAALGTIADIVPLVSENRILVKKGLEILNANPAKRFGIYNIIDEYLKNKNSISAKTIFLYITPVLNAAGRMGKASVAADLILSEDKSNADDFFVELKKLNNDRKQLQIENVKYFEKLLKEQCDIEKDKIFIVVAKNLSHGVTGIVAAQIVKMYSRPAILFISDGNSCVGACRSIEGFDIVSALDKVKDLIVKFGGHCQAAGLTVELDKIDELKKRLNVIAENSISSQMIAKKINVDCEVKISDINRKTFNDLNLLEPFGCSNVSPIFLVKNVKFSEIAVLGHSEEHLKLKIVQNGGNSVNAIFWNGAKYQQMIEYKSVFDVLCNLEINRDLVQISIIDIKNI